MTVGSVVNNNKLFSELLITLIDDDDEDEDDTKYFHAQLHRECTEMHHSILFFAFIKDNCKFNL